MNRGTKQRAPLAVGIAGLVLIIGGVMLFRSWQQRWNATPTEVTQPLPGDSIVIAPSHVTNLAITIAAPPELVWPWLVQIGNRRGGLYSYDLLDRWFGYLDAPSADAILSEFQGLKAGDTIPIGSGPGWPVEMLDPPRAFLLHIRADDLHVTWLFALSPEGSGGTRLVTRVRGSVRLTLARRAQLLVLDPTEFLMLRRMLLGIKARAERYAAKRS